jgi:hypothetical protein
MGFTYDLVCDTKDWAAQLKRMAETMDYFAPRAAKRLRKIAKEMEESVS